MTLAEIDPFLLNVFSKYVMRGLARTLIELYNDQTNNRCCCLFIKAQNVSIEQNYYGGKFVDCAAQVSSGCYKLSIFGMKSRSSLLFYDKVEVLVEQFSDSTYSENSQANSRAI